jgi:hypothetical protein
VEARGRHDHCRGAESRNEREDARDPPQRSVQAEFAEEALVPKRFGRNLPVRGQHPKGDGKIQA